jgi:hypothetical protein
MGKKEKGKGKKEDDLPEDDNADKAAGMVIWTKRVAFFLGFCAFCVMFIVCFEIKDYANTKMILIAAIKGFSAGLLIWVAGLIIGNIFIKGLVTGVPVDQDHLVDGGLLQRIYLHQQRLNYDHDGNVIQIDSRNDTIIRGPVKNKKPEGGS